MFLPFFGLFVVVGLGLLGWATYSTQRSLAVARWPVAEGRLLSSEIKESSDSDSGSTYRVVVSYEYRVNGVPFTGDRIAFGYDGSSGRATHQQILDRLRTARTVLVCYSPTNPKVSALSYGFHWSMKMLYVFAMVWLVLALGMACLFWLGSQPDDILLNNLGVR